LLRRNPRQVAVVLALLLLLDRRFYLCWRGRSGMHVAVAGLGLHVVHRLTSVAAVPLALTHHLRRKSHGDDV
jgi:hypothetical protein